MTKDKRLQIRVTPEELEGIQKRAKAVGLSVAEYGRSRLLAGENPNLPQQVALIVDRDEWGQEPGDPHYGEDPSMWDSFEGEPGPSYAAATAEDLEPEAEAQHAAEVRKIMEENGYDMPDWQPVIPKCDVEDVPPGVRCIKCGRVHGS